MDYHQSATQENHEEILYYFLCLLSKFCLLYLWLLDYNNMSQRNKKFWSYSGKLQEDSYLRLSIIQNLQESMTSEEENTVNKSLEN